MTYKLIVAYDGTKYKGWQRLDENTSTVQGKLEHVISSFLGKPTEIIGSGRTDAGVHALRQTASFSVPYEIDCCLLTEYMTRYLPEDISVVSLTAVSSDFHARFSVKSKTYTYRILTKPNPFQRRYAMSVFSPLDIDAMKTAGEFFVGTHDFTAFTNAKAKKKSKVRTVYRLDIDKKGDIIEITICGSGFLHNMVRRIAGLMIEIGLGRVDASAVPEIIESLDRSRINLVAEAKGLFLTDVEY